jgi:hypothetical protein
MKDLDGLIADHDAHADALLARYELTQEQEDIAREYVASPERRQDLAERLSGRGSGVCVDPEEVTWSPSTLDETARVVDVYEPRWEDEIERDYAGPDYQYDLEEDPDYWAGRR